MPLIISLTTETKNWYLYLRSWKTEVEDCENHGIVGGHNDSEKGAGDLRGLALTKRSMYLI